MTNFAKIVDGIVETVIVADEEFIASIAGQWVQAAINTPVGVGYSYDPALNTFIAPPISTELRAATRSALRQQWDGLPAWINGPYRPLFDAANRLLDEGADEAAFEMIDAVEPTTKITNDPEKEAIFAAVKAQFATAIQSLNP
jgi:hypothetical protein